MSLYKINTHVSTFPASFGYFFQNLLILLQSGETNEWRTDNKIIYPWTPDTDGGGADDSAETNEADKMTKLVNVGILGGEVEVKGHIHHIAYL